MKDKRARPGECVIEHVGKQVKRRVVGKVRRREDVLQILQTEAANPRIINDILRIIETEKVDAKNACVEERACDRQRHKNSSVRLPRSGQEWSSDSNTSSRTAFLFRRAAFLFAALRSCQGFIRRAFWFLLRRFQAFNSTI